MGAIKPELLHAINRKVILTQFLKTQGEGVYYIAFLVSNFDEVISRFKEQGVKILVGGCVEGNPGYI